MLVPAGGGDFAEPETSGRITVGASSSGGSGGCVKARLHVGRGSVNQVARAIH